MGWRAGIARGQPEKGGSALGEGGSVSLMKCRVLVGKYLQLVVCWIMPLGAGVALQRLLRTSPFNTVLLLRLRLRLRLRWLCQLAAGPPLAGGVAGHRHSRHHNARNLRERGKGSRQGVVRANVQRANMQ